MPRASAFTLIRKTLQAHANAEHAPAMSAYMREQFPFLGIKTPQRRALIKSVAIPNMEVAELFDLVDQLWNLPEREFQYAAIDLLAKQHKRLAIGDVAHLLKLAQEKSWWDSVDGLASVVGDILQRERRIDASAQVCMDQALHHDNLWVRRIAMTHQLGWRLETDEQRLLSYAVKLAPEDDFFIRKAIGWALRDYARWGEQAVARFVHQHQTRLSPLSQREALRRIDV